MPIITLNAHSSSGFVRSQNAVWATSRAAVTGDSVGEEYIGAELSGGSYDIYRYFAKFDTSALSGSVITAADLKIYPVSRDTSTNFTLVTTTHTAPDTTLTTADFDSLTVTTPTERASRTANVSAIALSTYLTISLNAGGLAEINKTGYSKFAFRSSLDVDNSTPGDRSYLEIGTDAGANPPQLVVTYTPAASMLLVF